MIKLHMLKIVFILSIFVGSVHAYSQPFKDINENDTMVITIEKNDINTIITNDMINKNNNKVERKYTPPPIIETTPEIIEGINDPNTSSDKYKIICGFFIFGLFLNVLASMFSVKIHGISCKNKYCCDFWFCQLTHITLFYNIGFLFYIGMITSPLQFWDRCTVFVISSIFILIHALILTSWLYRKMDRAIEYIKAERKFIK